MKFLMRNALGSNHVSEGILIKSISFDSLFLFQFKTFKIQTCEPYFRTWTWGYENSEDGETNPQDFKVTKNFSLHINLLRLDFFYKALEKDKNRFGEKLAVPGVTVKRKWQRIQVGKGVCSVLGRVASEFPTLNDD